MIRRLTPPQIPPALYEAGWRLRHGSYGWQCVTRMGQATHCYPAPGVAIAAAWDAAEPDHERLSKLNRQFYRIIMKLECAMSDQPNDATSRAQQLLDSLYESGDLSVDQHAGIAAGLAHVATLDTYIARLEADRETSVERFRQLLGELDDAKAKATILQAQLGGWEAACAAQVLSARAYIGQMGVLEHTSDQLAARHRLVDAIETNAGQLLLQKLQQIEAERDQYRHANGLAAQSYVQLEGELARARSREATAIESRDQALRSEDAERAARRNAEVDVQALREALDTVGHIARHPDGLAFQAIDAYVRRTLERAHAGASLIARFKELEAAVRQAGHADSCALQYGGACDCRMQLVRR